MTKKKVVKLSSFLIVAGFVAYAFMSYLRIARLDLPVNPRCRECFSPAKNHAGCLIAVDKKILLVRDKKSKKFGFPAGRHELGERAFQTAYRETLEETGLRVVLDAYIEEFASENFRLFKCNIIEDTGKHDNEIMEVKYADKKELKDIIDTGNARFKNQLEYVYNHFEELNK